MTDWHAWHADYHDPQSSLSRRLIAVRRRVAESLGDGTQVHGILSLCAGDGRDVIPVVAALPPERRPEVVLVELDPSLADAARRRAAEVALAASVVIADAGRAESWKHTRTPDLLMLCGIFGNVPDADVQRTITAATAIVRPGGRVIWTRGHRAGRDMRPVIRRWFLEAGFEELSFDSEPVGFGVGVHQLVAPDAAVAVPDRLFSFRR